MLNQISDHDVMREWRYSSTAFLASALVGGKWSVTGPGRFTTGEGARYPFDRRLGGP